MLAAASLALPLAGAAAHSPTRAAGQELELVALLDGQALAARPGRANRIALEHEQAAVATRIHDAVPAARIRWRYQLVLNGLAVVAPASAANAIAAIPGVREVQASIRYHRTLFRTPQVIGAPQVWGPTLATAGDGIKIGILDDGVDQTHPFFTGSAFAPPASFPKGNSAYTTAKVIVARSFPPPGASWPYAKLPFDPRASEHGTHVAGIAAGDHGTTAKGPAGDVQVSGVAPRAYIGNYRVLTIPTDDFGLDGNSPEIVAGIEQAVRDGMDVINLSLGEPEIDAVPRHRRPGDRRGRRRRRRAGDRGRKRLRRAWCGFDRIARLGAERDHRSCRDEGEHDSRRFRPAARRRSRSS